MLKMPFGSASAGEASTSETVTAPTMMRARPTRAEVLLTMIPSPVDWCE
jgi:hypothetical protein